MIIKAAFITLHANWPWKRQLPGGHPVLDGVEFFVPVDEADIVFVYDALPQKKFVLDRPVPVVFVASEPENVKRYKPGFLAQFGAVITSDRDTPHPNRIFTQAGLPWHVGTMSAGGQPLKDPMLFDDFTKHDPRKTKLVSVVSSDKAFTPQHRARLDFVQKLKAALGDQVDVFGRGIADFPDKRDVLDAYRYHIALENCSVEDYWTEKLADPYLTLTFPIYHGCPNIKEYFSEESFKSIDIYKPDEAVETIRAVINSDLAQQNREHLLEARRKVMYEHNVFALLARVAKETLSNKSSSTQGSTTLYAESHFMPIPSRIEWRLRTWAGKRPLLIKTARSTKNHVTSIRRRLLHYYQYLTNEFYRSHQKWITEHPKEELRFKYDLPHGANILDVGGYAGEFAARYVDQFSAHVTVFEPIPSFAAQIRERFAGDARVQVHEAGLSDRDQSVEFDLAGDASGAFGTSSNQRVQVALWDAERFLSQCGTDNWHLVKLNIEGGEYALLRRLIDTGRIDSIEHIQVQFHLHLPDARQQYKQLAKRLQRTHKLEWRYPFVWESWVRRTGVSR